MKTFLILCILASSLLTMSSTPFGQPVAVDDVYTAYRGATLSVDAPGVLANDQDAESAELVFQAQFGVVQLAENGSFFYTPEGDFVGDDVFFYLARNKQGVSSAKVTIHVRERPTATVNSLTVMENADHANVQVSITGTDEFSSPFSLTLVLTGTGCGLDLDCTEQRVPVQPGQTDLLFSVPLYDDSLKEGNETFTLHCRPGGSMADLFDLYDGILTIDDDENAAPLAFGDSYTVVMGSELLVPVPGVLWNDTDDDNDPLSVLSKTEPAHGLITLDASGRFLYRPSPLYTGTDSFAYQITDGYDNSDWANVTVTVINNAPIAVDDSYSIVTGEILVVSAPGVLANDSDPDGHLLEAKLISSAQHGQVEMQNDGSFIYVPDSGFVGEDTFSYRVTDGNAMSTGSVRIAVSSHKVWLPVLLKQQSDTCLRHEREPNDTIGTSNDGLCFGVVVIGTHDGSAGTGDLYRLDVQAGDTLNVSMETGNPNGVQLLLYRWNNDTAELVGQSVAAPFSLSYTASADSLLYIYVYSDAGTNNGDEYELLVNH